MENELKCFLVLSLKEMTLRKAAISLFTDSDTVAPILKFPIPGCHSSESTLEWQAFIKDKIKTKVSTFKLPESLEQQVIDRVRPIVFQIRRWRDCQEFLLSTEEEKISLPASLKLSWTSTGTINYRKTAQELVRCDILDVLQRYKLACMNCLKDDIRLLQKKLPEQQNLFVFQNVRDENPGLPLRGPHLLASELWALGCPLSELNCQPSSVNQWGFECSAAHGNTVAVDYFIQKLTPEEKDASLTKTLRFLLESVHRLQGLTCKYLNFYLHEKLSDVSCYLLAQMNPARRMEVFREHPAEVLLRFLDCPWPDLFLENVALFWEHLPPSNYSSVLLSMAHRFIRSGHHFPVLFREFFVRSPPDCKKCFVDVDSPSNKSPSTMFLYAFFASKDLESLKVIFRNLDAEERMRLALSNDVLKMFAFMTPGGWNFLEVCLLEAARSAADRRKLRSAFVARGGGGRKDDECLEERFDRLVGFFDFIVERENKCQKRKPDFPAAKAEKKKKAAVNC